MVSLHHIIQTALACVTVKKVISTPNSTNPTFIAMKDLFLFEIIVKQVANATEIPCKLNFAFLAGLLTWLDGVAIIAFYFGNAVSIYLMVKFRVFLVMIFYIVMTQPTRKKFFAFRTFLLTPAFVMLAPKFGVDLSFFFFWLWLLLWHILTSNIIG